MPDLVLQPVSRLNVPIPLNLPRLRIRRFNMAVITRGARLRISMDLLSIV